MTDKNFQNEQVVATTQSEVKSSQNYKPYFYTAIVALIAVGGLGYYLMPEKVAYEPVSGLDDVSENSNTQTTAPLPPQNSNEIVTPVPTPVACTMDAMMCPDGSYVGRSGQNCEFVCPTNLGVVTSNQSNTVVRTEWGVRMEKANDWIVIGYQEPSNDGLFSYFQLENTQGINKGDRITIKHWPNIEFLENSDNKFGDVIYYWDKITLSWKKNSSGEMGQWTYGVSAMPVQFTQDNLPVFSGTHRWKTYIIPLDKNRFLEMNITGGGDTIPLDNLLKTLKVIERE